MTDFVTRSLLLGKMRENNTFADAVRAAHTGDLQGLAFILRCAGSTIVSLGRVSDFAAELIASFEELCAELDAAAADKSIEQKAVMLDAIESISSDLGLKFRVEFDTDRGDWLAQACSADDLEWYTGAGESFAAAVQSLLNTLNEIFFEE